MQSTPPSRVCSGPTGYGDRTECFFNKSFVSDLRWKCFFSKYEELYWGFQILQGEWITGRTFHANSHRIWSNADLFHQKIRSDHLNFKKEYLLNPGMNLFLDFPEWDLFPQMSFIVFTSLMPRLPWSSCRKESAASVTLLWKIKLWPFSKGKNVPIQFIWNFKTMRRCYYYIQ